MLTKVGACLGALMFTVPVLFGAAGAGYDGCDAASPAATGPAAVGPAAVGPASAAAASAAAASAAAASAAAASAAAASAAAASADDVAPTTLAAIDQLRPLYDKVAQEKDIAWSVLAAVDYRESNNDSAASALSGEAIGTANPDNGAVTTSKLDSLRRAGDHLRAMAASVYGVALTAASPEPDVKAALLAYNRGFIYKNAGANWEASPYVMNRFDAAHMDMAWPTLAGEPLAGLVDTRYGAWTLVASLRGATEAACDGLALGALTLADRPDEPTELANVGGITVSARLAPYLAALLAAAAADGIVLGGSGYRSTEAQVRLRLANGCPDVYTAPASSCGTPTAIPGRSMHEVGEAVDFSSHGQLITSRDDPAYRWLAANAARYGLHNLPSEPWHFSTNGR